MATDEQSTAADVPDTSRGAAERWWVRAGLLLLLVVVVAGATGLLGTRTTSTSASGGDKVLMVTYPAISRAGQPAPLHIRVTSEAGFDGPIRLALCDDLFDDLDFQNWYPNPSKETGDASRLEYEFDPPEGHTFEVSLDARSAPGQFGEVEDCRVSLREEKADVASVTFHSWRMP
ncbi:MAG TPA: hypothetical protein VHO29_18500 [Marmoricola sp.]|nr:hypothetical protein [Marmoricola sp.]